MSSERKGKMKKNEEFEEIYSNSEIENKRSFSISPLFIAIIVIIVMPIFGPILLYTFSLLMDLISKYKIISYITDFLIVILLIILSIKIRRGFNIRDMKSNNYKYVKMYMNYFLSNYATAIFNNFNYSVLDDIKDDKYYKDFERVTDYYFNSSGYINEHKFSLVGVKKYTISPIDEEDYPYTYTQFINKKGLVMKIDCQTIISGTLELLPRGINRKNKLKINNKKLKKLFTFYSDRDLSYLFNDEVFANNFIEIINKITPYYTSLTRMYYPDVQITIKNDQIIIYMGLSSMFNDLKPFKKKTKMYYEKFCNLNSLAMLLIQKFETK